MAMWGDPPTWPPQTTIGRIAFDYSPVWTWTAPRPRLLGWECPKCGAVYGPQVEACKHCAPKGETND